MSAFDLARLLALTIAATEQALTGQPGPMPSPQGDGAHEPYPDDRHAAGVDADGYRLLAPLDERSDR